MSILAYCYLNYKRPNEFFTNDRIKAPQTTEQNHNKQPKKHQKICLALNVTVLVKGSVSMKADDCPNERENYKRLFSALPAPVPLYFDGVTLKR